MTKLRIRTMTKILIVEDDAPLRTMAEEVVRALKSDPIGVVDGFQAIRVAEATPGIEILVTDINLGRGPTGWEVAKRIKQTHPNVRVIYTSGLSDASDHLRHGLAGSSLLPKPYTLKN